MTVEKKEYETELIITNVRSKDNSVILDLSFTKRPSQEPPKRRLENVIEPLPKSQMERAGSDIAKGYMSVMQKQLQQQMQQLSQFVPPTPPPDSIRITLSKQEYVKLGRPTIDDKITLKLKMKGTQR